MRRTLPENRREPVVVGILIVLNGADPAKKLVRAPSIDVSHRTTGQRLVVIKVAIEMDGVRTEVLQLGARSSPHLLPPRQVPLIELLGWQMRSHGNRIDVG